MKKILALLITVAMLLPMLTLPTFASETPEDVETSTTSSLPTPQHVMDIPDDVYEVEYDDGNGRKTYFVIRTLAEFLAIQNENNYILANDIDFSAMGSITSAGYVAATGNFILEGNGYTIDNLTIAYTAGAGKGMFGQLAANTTTKVRNLTINANGTIKANATGVLFGTDDSSTDIHVYIEGVTINSQNLVWSGDGDSTHGASVFYAKPRGNVYFKDCVVNGFTSIAASQKHGVAGFVGRMDAANRNVTFDNCHAIGTYTYSNAGNIGEAIFVGYVKESATGSTITFTDCTANAKLTSKGTRSGAFVGYNRGATITFTGCKLLGDDYDFANSYCAGFVAYHRVSTLSFTNCSIEGNLNLKNTKNGGFVGCHEAPVTFTNCSIAGELKITASEAGGFIGSSNAECTFNNCDLSGSLTGSASQSGGFCGYIGNAGAVSFTDCTSDAALFASADRVSLFVGQIGSKNTVTFERCTAGGTMISNAAYNGAFVGAAGAAGLAPTVTFTQCTADVLVIGNDCVSPYVGSNEGGTPALTFDACTNNAAVYSLGTAGAWIAQINAEGVAVTVGANCQNNATVNSVKLFNGTELIDGTVTAEDLASGAFAYAISATQMEKNVKDSYLFGQEIGKDSVPVMGGKRVYQIDLLRSEVFYSNTWAGVMTVQAEDNGAAKAYFQTGINDMTHVNSRIIMAVREDVVQRISTMQIRIDYTLKDSTVKSFECTHHDVNCFYAVYAGDMIAEAEDGYVLLALVVKNIPTEEWDGESVAITMSATDIYGSAMPEMQLDAYMAPQLGPQQRPIAVIKETTLYLFEGDTKTLRFSVDANGALTPNPDDVVWKSTTDCVTVENGVVTAVKQGYAYVSGGGDTQCLIRVVPQEMPEVSVDTGGVEVVRDVNDIDKYYECTVSVTAESNTAFNLSNKAAGIRVRGNSTARADKKPYRIKFEKKQNLLGMHEGEKFKSWVLLSEPYDDSMIRNTTALSLASYIVDNYSSDWRYVKLTLNGTYRGVYVVAEQSQVNKMRINIEEAGEDSAEVMSGYLFEMDASPLYDGIKPEGDLEYGHEVGKIILSYKDWTIIDYDGKAVFDRSTNDNGTRKVLITLKNDGLTDEQQAFAEKYIQNVFKILYYATQRGIYYEFDENYDLVEVKNTDSEATLSKAFDIESWVRMYIHSEMVMNGDQSKKSFYMWVDCSANGTGLLTFGCPWDFDSAFCGYKSYNFQNTETILAGKRNLWYSMVLNCDWFREEVCRVWGELYEESNGFANTSDVLNNIVKYYKDEIDGDAALWNRTHDHEEYAVKTRDWVKARVAWLNSQFDVNNPQSIFMYP